VVYGIPKHELEYRPAPAALTACNRTLYVLPFVKPLIIMGDLVPVDVHVIPLSIL
jgi:hypothetical protein